MSISSQSQSAEIRLPDYSGKSERTNIRTMKLEPDSLTPAQQAFVDAFIVRYNARTAKSKQLIQQHRARWSDWLNSLCFRRTLKEALYPIMASHSAGSRLWDIDGNEYIDLAMGYGVSFFGNDVPFIKAAMEAQLQKGFALGPQYELTAEVVQLICEMTGNERVTFCNSGTEADMVALRLARAATGKNKIAFFAGSYHGTFDGVLALADAQSVFPMAVGTTQHTVQEDFILNYGTPEALESIRRNAHELAAVLVEPVQSRRPGFQPKEFLQELRRLTAEKDIALIFDEVITGFRIHPGGAQHWFDVRADIVTYGKVIGGGMPIGVVSGQARYLDGIDGGFWRFGDDSGPTRPTPFFAGTFCKHPLTMAATRAVLLHLKAHGPQLQQQVNTRTADLVSVLNQFFQQENVPIQVNHFGSIFRFESFGQYHLSKMPLEMDLLFQLLLEKGIYTWERRICFLSTAHTEADIERIIQAVKECIGELRAGGFTFSTDSIL